jgi:2-methylcitrate dehydratase PrpD
MMAVSVTASARIAAFGASFASAPLTTAHRHQAYRAMLDTIACAIAGRNDEASRLAEAYMRGSAGAGPATVWATGETMHPEGAAFVNGVAAHVLDYDDVMTPMRGHISVAMVPALCALAQANNATGEQFSSAYLAGFELMAKFARVMALPHYSRGWHSTSALGVLGATLACSVLLGLNETQTSHALGLAVAQAAGSRQNFGAMAKSFQAGQCNAAAVRAVLMAQSGFTAAPDAIDGKFGYLALYASGENVSPALSAIGTPPLEIDAMGIDIKKYPCCYAIHRALDGLLALRKAHALTPVNVTKIVITNSAGGLDALLSQPPVNGLQAKFNMAYCMAAALPDGAIRLASFDDAQVMRPEVRALLPKVSLQEAPGAILPRWSHVRIELVGGQVLELRVNTARGDAGDPLSDAELIEKVADCFAYGNFGADAGGYAQLVFGLATRRVGDAILALHASKVVGVSSD